MLADMKTLTIRLSETLAQRLEQEALARRISKSELVRERLDGPGLPPLKEGDLLNILEGAWSANVPATPRRFRSPVKQRVAEAVRAKKLHR